MTRPRLVYDHDSDAVQTAVRRVLASRETLWAERHMRVTPDGDPLDVSDMLPAPKPSTVPDVLRVDRETW